MNILRVSGKKPPLLPGRAVHKQCGIFSQNGPQEWMQAAHCSNMWADVKIIGWKLSIHGRYIQAESDGTQFFQCAGKLLLKKTKFKRQLIEHRNNFAWIYLKEIDSADAWLRHFSVNEYPSLLAILSNNPYTFWKNWLLINFSLHRTQESPVNFTKTPFLKVKIKMWL